MNNRSGTLLVTGATRGLGYEYIRYALGAGENVLAVGRNFGDNHWLRQQENGQSLALFECDLAEHDLADRLTDFMSSNSLSVDRVLHAAGGGLGRREELLSWQDFQDLFSANLFGASEINRVLVPIMREGGYGRIVHVGSTAATHAVGSVGYNTVKAALGAYVRSLGRCLTSDNIVVSGINPGAFLAEDNAMERLSKNRPEVFDSFVNDRLPRKFMAHVSEIYGLIDFLLSREASMLGGSMVAIDAGESLAYD